MAAASLPIEGSLRERVLFLQTSVDHNGAFADSEVQPILKALSKDADITAIKVDSMRSFMASLEMHGERADILVLAGHGEKCAITMAEDAEITSADFLEKIPLPACGKVVLIACSTGECKETSLAAKIARTGRAVLAPSRIIYLKEIYVNPLYGKGTGFFPFNFSGGRCFSEDEMMIEYTGYQDLLEETDESINRLIPSYPICQRADLVRFFSRERRNRAVEHVICHTFECVSAEEFPKEIKLAIQEHMLFLNENGFEKELDEFIDRVLPLCSPTIKVTLSRFLARCGRIESAITAACDGIESFSDLRDLEDIGQSLTDLIMILYGNGFEAELDAFIDRVLPLSTATIKVLLSECFASYGRIETAMAAVCGGLKGRFDERNLEEVTLALKNLMRILHDNGHKKELNLVVNQIDETHPNKIIESVLFCLIELENDDDVIAIAKKMPVKVPEEIAYEFCKREKWDAAYQTAKAIKNGSILFKIPSEFLKNGLIKQGIELLSRVDEAALEQGAYALIEFAAFGYLLEKTTEREALYDFIRRIESIEDGDETKYQLALRFAPTGGEAYSCLKERRYGIPVGQIALICGFELPRTMISKKEWGSDESLLHVLRGALLEQARTNPRIQLLLRTVSELFEPGKIGDEVLRFGAENLFDSPLFYAFALSIVQVEEVDRRAFEPASIGCCSTCTVC